jgi:hypothetical protein
MNDNIWNNKILFLLNQAGVIPMMHIEWILPQEGEGMLV